MTPKFIENAFSVAYVLNEGEHYKISKSLDSKGSDNSQYDSAISIDLVSTGMLQKTMKYSGGIQQFLEMKHQLALSEPTLTTNFISNFCFYKRFKNIYGLSGTLGNDSDQNFLREELELTSQKIPSHKGSSTRILESLIEEEEDVEDNIDTGAEKTDIGNILKVNKIQKDTKADVEIQIETQKVSKWASIRYIAENDKGSLKKITPFVTNVKPTQTPSPLV